MHPSSAFTPLCTRPLPSPRHASRTSPTLKSFPTHPSLLSYVSPPFPNFDCHSNPHTFPMLHVTGLYRGQVRDGFAYQWSRSKLCTFDGRVFYSAVSGKTPATGDIQPRSTLFNVDVWFYPINKALHRWYCSEMWLLHPTAAAASELVSVFTFWSELKAMKTVP